MPTNRLAAQVEKIDPETLAVTPADATALLDLTGRMTTARLKGKTDRETVKDAAQVAALLACSLLTSMDGDLTATAALASYRASLAALEDLGTTREDAADLLNTDEDEGLLRLALPSSPRPDAMTLTTDRDRLADAVNLLSDQDPYAAQVVAWTTYLPEGEGQTTATAGSSHALGSAVKIGAMMGLSERQRKALGKALPAITEALADAMTATLHHHATRTHYGASREVWTLHRSHREDCQPTDPTARQYGRPRVTPRSGPASAVVYRSPFLSAPRLQVTPGPATIDPSTREDLVPLTEITDDMAAYVLSQTATFPTYGRTTTDSHGDAWAAAQEPIGPVRKSSSIKRKRDGAIGSPMTSGSTRPRY